MPSRFLAGGEMMEVRQIRIMSRYEFCVSYRQKVATDPTSEGG